MDNDKRVVVNGGGKNLYIIQECDGWFNAYHITGVLSRSKKHIGKARSQSDAIDLIKSHSGKDIEEIG